MMNLMKPFKINWIKYVLMACCLAAPLAWDEASAWAQSIDFETSASEINAGVPFQLTITVSDVDRSPTPVVEPFTIENAQVTPMGTSSSVSIINGVVNVQYKFSFTIVPETVGHYVLPQIKVTQGSKSFESQKRVSFDASDVALSRDMRIELELPDRALWVGESMHTSTGTCEKIFRRRSLRSRFCRSAIISTLRKPIRRSRRIFAT